jgi:CBS domain-containing protein
MSTCPYCGVEMIEGLDECEQCGQTLTDLSIPAPSTRVEADLLLDCIEVLAPRTPSTVAPTTPVGDALKKMVAEQIGCVMVVEDDKLVGIFTERDAVTRLNTDATRLATQPIANFMTHDPVTLSSKDEIAFAVHKMNLGGYRHVPILVAGTLSGVISVRDILHYLTSRIAVAGQVAGE